MFGDAQHINTTMQLAVVCQSDVQMVHNIRSGLGVGFCQRVSSLVYSEFKLDCKLTAKFKTVSCQVLAHAVEKDCEANTMRSV